MDQPLSIDDQHLIYLSHSYLCPSNQAKLQENLENEENDEFRVSHMPEGYMNKVTSK